jgi:predicted nuclease with TOPRIM domain
MDQIEATLLRLAEAQARTEERVGALGGRMDRVEAALTRLAEAQARTEERVGGLEGRMDRVEAALTRLAEAQARTEEAVQRLQENVRQLQETTLQLQENVRQLQENVRQLQENVRQLQETTRQTQQALQQLARQVGGLSETVGGDIEDIAYIVLYDVLQREFGWDVGVLERTWQQWDGESEEVNVFGQATDPARPEQPIWIVGEAKHNLTLREVERFALQAERARRHLPGKVYAVCFCYRARPEVRVRLRDLGIPLVFSYGRFA